MAELPTPEPEPDEVPPAAAETVVKGRGGRRVAESPSEASRPRARPQTIWLPSGGPMPLDFALSVDNLPDPPKEKPKPPPRKACIWPV
jgi:hypothetical protein